MVLTWMLQLQDGERALLFTEQVLVVATIVGSIAALPALIEFFSERRKRTERIRLSLENVAVSTLSPRLAGIDPILEDISDLIDRAKYPATYKDLKLGNEILIIGPPSSGKKSLAYTIAKRANMDRLITVFNPRNADVLAAAKSAIHDYRRSKVMLLLPRLDLAYEHTNEEVLSELDALVDATTDLPNVLVVGTAVRFLVDSELDSIFGVKLSLPGTHIHETAPSPVSQETRKFLSEVVQFYIDKAKQSGYVLEGMTEAQCIERILNKVTNPAEVEDIVYLCQTAALYQKRMENSLSLTITPEILGKAMKRVILD